MPEMFTFPAIAKSKRENDMLSQIAHIQQEVDEANAEAEAMGNGKTKLCVELFDIVHAAETALRMVYEETPGTVLGAYFMCKSKNESRGYYDDEA